MLAKKRARYARAGKKHKTKIINERVELFDYHRKAAIRAMPSRPVMAALQPCDARKPGSRATETALNIIFFTRLLNPVCSKNTVTFFLPLPRVSQSPSTRGCRCE